MGTARPVPMWRRLWLPRSATIAGLPVQVPLRYAIMARKHGLRVVYRFPPVTTAQATFHVELLQIHADSNAQRPATGPERCQHNAAACTFWFADPPAKSVACIEAPLGRSEAGDDLGSSGLCSPSPGGVRVAYGCMGEQCAVARQIITEMFLKPEA